MVYFITPDLVPRLYNASFYESYLFMDDVYITGLLANRLTNPQVEFRKLSVSVACYVTWPYIGGLSVGMTPVQASWYMYMSSFLVYVWGLVTILYQCVYTCDTAFRLRWFVMICHYSLAMYIYRCSLAGKLSTKKNCTVHSKVVKFYWSYTYQCFRSLYPQAISAST